MNETLTGIFLGAVDAHRKPDLFLRPRGEAWEPVSAERAEADVESLMLGLEAMGVRKGDTVAILAESRYEWPVADLAILALGAVTVPIYTTLTAEQCRYLLENAGVKTAIASTPLQVEKIRTAAAGLPRFEHVIVMDPGSNGAAAVALAEVMARGAEARGRSPGALRERASRVRPDDLATIIYTSGTTGEPKGVMLTHRNIASNVAACLSVVDIGPGDRCLSFLPLSHVFERMAGLYSMLGGGATIAYAHNMESVATDAREVRPTILTGVPRFYEKVHARILEQVRTQPPLRQKLFHWAVRVGAARARARFAGRSPGPWLALRAWLADRLVAAKVRGRIGGRLRICISGGAPLPSHVMEFFFAIGIPVLEGYGLTETSPVITLNRLGQERPGSVGTAVPGVEVRIGDDGEILARGPNIMQGYFGNEAATRTALAGGWFHTGDIGHLDEQGRLHITDRLKDLLVTAGGKKVAPQPIEGRLKESPWVQEAVLLGDRRPYVVCLFVPDFAPLEAEARARGWPAERAALLAHPEVRARFQAEVDRVNADLAPFERIKRFALLDRELSAERGEVTPSLKVRRKIVMDRFASEIEALYVAPAVPAPAA